MNHMTKQFLATLLLIVGSAAVAQQATEVYIPIGESPGISGVDSIIGSISSVDTDRYRVTISSAGESRTITMKSTTRYYVDRTRSREKSDSGSFEDCSVGRRMEAYVDAEGNAIWVKIEPSE